jgi:hypothetical protein
MESNTAKLAPRLHRSSRKQRGYRKFAVSDVAATAALTSPSAPPASQSSGLGRSMWSHGSFSFKDVLDIVNPLQHLPVVGSIYRYLTGDEPSAGTRIIGDALYGGPIGFGVSAASTALLTGSDGKDVGERLLADVFGSHDSDSDPTVGAPQVATADGQPATPAPMPEWMAAAGTPDGQPRTPAPANQQSAATRAAATTAPAKPMAYVPPARSAAAMPAARSIASVSAPMSAAPQQSRPATPAVTAPQQSVPVMAAEAQSVPMNTLFRSAQPPAASTPEQTFAAQAAQFQHQISQGRGANGTVINNRPVPLELSGNLLPVMPAGGHLSVGPGVPQPAGQAAPPASSTTPASGQAQASKPAAGNAPDQSAIAQKMIDALNKYEVLKKQEQQQDSGDKADPAKVDVSL